MNAYVHIQKLDMLLLLSAVVVVVVVFVWKHFTSVFVISFWMHYKGYSVVSITRIINPIQFWKNTRPYFSKMIENEKSKFTAGIDWMCYFLVSLALRVRFERIFEAKRYYILIEPSELFMYYDYELIHYKIQCLPGVLHI